MRIVIAGAGDVGMHLARLLSQEEQDITLIDKSDEKLNAMFDKYNFQTCTGNPISFKTLESAGVKNCDLFIAVTPFETENVISCQIARSLGAKKTVARIDNYEFMAPERVALFGLNTVIYPEYLAALEIRTALRHTWVRNWFEMYDGAIIVVGVKLHKNAEIIGMSMRELTAKDHNFHVSAILRFNEIIIPDGEDRLRENDIIYVTTTPDYVETLRERCGKRSYPVRKIMIAGASRIAIRLIKLFEDDDEFVFKVVDSDEKRIQKILDYCPNVEIIRADVSDIDTLRDEGMGQADVFISLLDSSESNILLCLTAREYGVKKTIAEVENLQLIAAADNLNISTIINKKLLASSTIFQFLLDSDNNDSRCLALTDAEVAEIDAKPKSKITRELVKDLNLPRHEMTLAALIRDGEGSLIGGNTQIVPGDRVVVFCRQGMLHKIEKLFN